MTPKAQHQKLEWKLTGVTLQTCAVVLLLALAATLTYESVHSRQEVLKHARVLADLVGQLSVASVASGDAAAAQGMLTPLRFNSNVVSVALYQRDGKRFAQFAREKREAPGTLDRAAASGPGHRWEGRELVVFVPLRSDQGVIGTLVLRKDSAGQRAGFQDYLLIAGGLGVGLLVLAFGIATVLQRTISRRLRELSQVVARIAQDQDYSVRADARDDGEIGALTEAFNGMLAQIERQTHSLGESEARFRQLGEAAFEGLAIVVDGKLVDANPQMAKLLGYDLPEMIGRPVEDFIAPESRELVAAQIRLRHEASYEVFHLRKDGSVFPGEAHSRQVDRAGQQVRMTAVRDLTQHKQAVAALRESEERFGKIFQAAPVLISLSDLADGRYVVVNDRFCTTSGFSQQEAVGHTAMELGWIAAADRVRLIAELELNGRVSDRELIRRRKDGSEVVCLLAAELVVLGGRKMLLSISSDITHLKRTEEALRANQWMTADALAFNRRVLDTAPIGILTFNAAGRCLLANEAAATMAGTKVAGLLGQNLHQIPSWKEAGLYDAAFQALSFGRPVPLEVWHTTILGERLCLRLFVSSFLSGRDTHFLVITVDITQQKLGELALLEANQHLEAHIANSPLGIIEFDPDLCLIRWSGAAPQIFGWPENEILGKAIPEIRWLHEDDAAAVLQASAEMQAGRLRRNSQVSRNYRKDGTIISCEWYNSACYDGQGRMTSIFSLVLDVTVRQQAEQALRESETRLRAVLDSAVDGIITISERGIIESLNPAAVEMFGYSVGEMVGQNVTLLMPSPDREQHDRRLANYCETGVRKVIGLGLSHEASGRRRDGRSFPLELSVSEVRLDGRRSFTGIVRDITRRKQAEEELRQSEGRFRTLFKASPIAIALQGDDGRMIEVNDSYQRMLGYTEEELRKLGVKRITHPEDVAEGDRFYHELVAGSRDHYQREKRYFRKDREVIWGISTVSAIRSSGGKLQYLISTVEDITARRQAETVMRELASIVEHSADAIIGQTGAGVITSWNRSAERIYGYSAAEVVGHPLARLLPSGADGDLERTVRRLHAGSRVEEFETVGRRKDGTLIEVVMTLSPIRNERHGLAAASTIVRDITERKRLEREILRVGAEERRRISHELHDSLGQTLTGIAFKAKALQGRLAQAASPLAKDLGEVATLVSGAVAETRRLAQGLNPVEIENAGLVVALADLAAKTQHLFGLACNFRCAETELAAAPTTEAVLYRITQEAIHNAVSHGSPQTIEIELSRTADRLQLCVRDDGTGFDAAAITSSGMGLRIIQHRVHAHGGTLQIQSQPGAGTRIECSLPLVEPRAVGDGRTAAGAPLTPDSDPVSTSRNSEAQQTESLA